MILFTTLPKKTLLAAACLLTFACAGPGEKPIVFDNREKEAASREELKNNIPLIEKGDLIAVNYIGALEDGALFETTMADVAQDPNRKKVSWFQNPKTFAPAEFIVGEKAPLPGMADMALGMKAGDKKTITLLPERAFGPPNPQNIISFPCTRTIAKTMQITPREYVERFNKFPVKNATVQMTPYFKARVAKITENYAALNMLAKNGETIEDSIGTTTVQVNKENVVLTLKPKIGSPFVIEGRSGLITSSDNKTFTVDFNHPLAGKTLTVEVQIVSITRASEFAKLQIPWQENYQEGLDAVRKEGKPGVLILYAGWCSWCQKLLDETLQDPRIKRLKDRFVWIKIDSDKQTDIKDLYHQESFPMIVFLNRQGTVISSVNGFKDAAGFREELEKAYDQETDVGAQLAVPKT